MKNKIVIAFMLVGLSFNAYSMKLEQPLDSKTPAKFLAPEKIIYGNLLCAITYQNFEGIQAIVKENPDLRNIRATANGSSLLYDLMQMFEMYRDKVVFRQILKMFVEHGVDINERDEYGNTILHWVAGKSCDQSLDPKKRQHDLFEKCKVLIENGADPSLINTMGQTPAALAFCVKNRILAKYLNGSGKPFFDKQQEQGIDLQQQAALEEYYHSIQIDPAAMCPLL